MVEPAARSVTSDTCQTFRSPDGRLAGMTTAQQLRQAFEDRAIEVRAFEVRAFEVRAIEATVLDRLRQVDDAGRPPEISVDAAGGSPLRCCLRCSLPGEQVALVSYAPLRLWARQVGADPGPYDEVGPVFIHPRRCAGPDGTGYPAEFAGWPRVFRSYSAAGRILGGRLAREDEVRDPATAARLLDEIFADPEVALVHARAVEYGCFTFEARRREP